MAHDLNGPIGIALGFPELAKEAIDASTSPDLAQADTSKVRGYLEMNLRVFELVTSLVESGASQKRSP
ncbi:MAG: hypothetical protein O2921_06545 [Chloroflexi bacterium]|nr:hypothetical protein [Chloroflexota bacterium]MDA1282268.1 hypothetical protein [Chloroflexota bacterium]